MPPPLIATGGTPTDCGNNEGLVAAFPEKKKFLAYKVIILNKMRKKI
jgi:hypothetical protein